MAAKIRKGDTVMVITGKDIRRSGEVIAVDRVRGTVTVAGLNIAIRHQKQTPNEDGGRKPVELPIAISNVALVDPADGMRTRVGFRFEDGRKVRYAKRTGAVIDG
ncbi:MAG: 50S ribosomal protein L24 [Rhodobacteraceae bacterium]|nr:50S ribosomal protein L24 [Paracoccaceae bacterium]